MTQTDPPFFDPFASPHGDSVSARKPGGRRWLWIVIPLGIALVGGMVALAVILIRNYTSSDDYRAGDEFTSSDGTFTMTLPYGWVDNTREYRETYADDHGGNESSIEGMVTVDDLPIWLSNNFVSMSGHPRLLPGGSAEAEGTRSLNDWRSDFSSYEDMPTGEFTTDVGDEVWYGAIRGTEGGEEKMMVVAVVFGQDSYALFDLEISPYYPEAKDQLLDALKTLVFAPVIAPTASASEKPFYEARADGRTYSSEGRMSIIIPDDWTYLDTDADIDAVDPTISFDFLGFWEVVDAPMPPGATVSFIVGPGFEETSTALDTLAEEFGEIGDTRTDSNGIAFTTTAIEPWSLATADDAAWAQMTINYAGLEAVGFSGETYQRCYVLVYLSLGAIVCLEATPEYFDETVTSVEDALQTLTFHPGG